MTAEQMRAHIRALEEIVSSEEMAERVGQDIARVLELRRQSSNGRYFTVDGDKTAKGLARYLSRVIADQITGGVR